MLTLLKPTQKPPNGPVQLKDGHPLATGLVSLILCNEWGSQTIYDHVSGTAIPFRASTSWGSSATQTAGVLTSVAGSGAEVVVPASLKLNFPITLVWKGTILGAATNSSNYFGVSANNTDAAPFSCYRMGVGAAVYRAGFNISGTATNITSAVAPTAGPIWLASTYATGAQALYVQDPITAAATTSVAGATVTYAASSVLSLGQYTGPAARNPNALHEVAYIYNRVLTNAELAWLKAEPYCMIQPRAARRFISTVATSFTLSGGPTLANVTVTGTLLNTPPSVVLSGGPTLANVTVTGTFSNSSAAPGNYADPNMLWSTFCWRNTGTFIESCNLGEIFWSWPGDANGTIAVDYDVTAQVLAGNYKGATFGGIADWPQFTTSVDHGAILKLVTDTGSTATVTTTLNGAINSAVTTIPVNAAVGPTAADYVITVDSEQMRVTAAWGTTSLTVTRGFNSTTAASHSNAATVTCETIYRLPIATGLANSSHEIRLILTMPAPPTPTVNRWTRQLSFDFIRYCHTDGTAFASSQTYPYLRTAKAAFYGDSIAMITADRSWIQHLCDAMGWYPLISSYGAQGPDVAATTTGVPMFFTHAGDSTNNSWNFYSSGQSRLTGGVFIDQPNHIFINQGTNSGWSSAAKVTAFLQDLRVAAPSAHIWMMVPFGGFARTNITSGYNSWSDSNKTLVDPWTTESQLGLQGTTINGSTSNWRSDDTSMLHPTQDQGELGARMTKAVVTALGTSAGFRQLTLTGGISG